MTPGELEDHIIDLLTGAAPESDWEKVDAHLVANPEAQRVLRDCLITWLRQPPPVSEGVEPGFRLRWQHLAIAVALAAGLLLMLRLPGGHDELVPLGSSDPPLQTPDEALDLRLFWAEPGSDSGTPLLRGALPSGKDLLIDVRNARPYGLSEDDIRPLLRDDVWWRWSSPGEGGVILAIHRDDVEAAEPLLWRSEPEDALQEAGVRYEVVRFHLQ